MRICLLLNDLIGAPKQKRNQNEIRYRVYAGRSYGAPSRRPGFLLPPVHAMNYTEKMWQNYLDTVLSMYRSGYKYFEIARILESEEELVKAVIEKYSVEKQ